jgi:hypothetical protein
MGNAAEYSVSAKVVNSGFGQSLVTSAQNIDF